MRRVAITGQVASGKSTLLEQFKRCGAVTFSADATAHTLMAKDGAAVDAILTAFPKARASDGGIDRAAMRDIVWNEKDGEDALDQLEEILHPMIYQSEMKAYRKAKRTHGRRKIFVSEIPLLFESDYPKEYDYIVVAYVPPSLQRQRVLAREGMTEIHYERILARQSAVDEQMLWADVAIGSHQGKHESMRQVQGIMKAMRGRHGYT